jgi:hypothetical protein
MGDDLQEIAPYDWLTPEDACNLTAANTDLLACNQVLQGSLLASETKVTRLQGIINDSNRTWANIDCQMCVINLAIQAKHYETRLLMDREMHGINLANQAIQYEARLQELQERNNQLENESKNFRPMKQRKRFIIITTSTDAAHQRKQCRYKIWEFCPSNIGNMILFDKLANSIFLISNLLHRQVGIFTRKDMTKHASSKN